MNQKQSNNTVQHKKAGFTIIELLVAVSISAVLLVIGVARYTEFNKTQTLIATGQTLKNNLRDFQAKATAGVKPTNSAGCDTEVLNGYQVTRISSTQYQAEAICRDTAGKDVSSGVIVNYTIPPSLNITSLSSFRFLVPPSNQSKLVSAAVNNITIRTGGTDKTTAQTKWVSMCISLSGEIKDCGISTGATPPTCTC